MKTVANDSENAAMTAASDAQDPAVATETSRIEAYGVKGMNNRPWRRTFKDAEALSAWCEKNDAEVYGQRFVERP